MQPTMTTNARNRFSYNVKPLHKLCLYAALIMSPVFAFAANQPASPDPALVSRYMNDSSARAAKYAECEKKKGNIAAVQADVGCMSILEADRQKSFSKCDAMETFVFVPPNVKGKDVNAYLLKHMPADSALKNCGQTKEQWLQMRLKALEK